MTIPILQIVSDSINHYEQSVWFKPSLVFILMIGKKEYSLDIPMLSNILYVTQPFFTLENYSSNLYYWADYIERINTTSLRIWPMYYQEFTLSVDLYTLLDKDI